MLSKTEKSRMAWIQNFKNPKQYFCEGQWEEISGEVWKQFKGDLREELCVEVFAPIGSYVNALKKQIRKKKLKKRLF